MESVNAAVASVQLLIEPHLRTVSLIMILLLVVSVRAFWPSTLSADKLPALRDTIPYISNTYQYMTNMRKFLTRTTEILRRKHIVRFYLGPQQVFFITGSQNIQALFRTTPSISSDKFLLIMLDTVCGATKRDIDKFTQDKSGRLKIPAPGWEQIPNARRYWAGLHNIMHEYLSRTYFANKLAETYYRLLSEHLNIYPIGEWTEVHILRFLKKDMTEAALTSLLGSQILHVNPDMVELLWDYDTVLSLIAYGPPKWMFRGAWKKRERYLAALGRYLEAAWANFDWNGPDAESDWEPHFGARFAREFAKWMKESDFTSRTSAGMFGVLGALAMNSNTIPTATWAVMELARDPSLFQAIRDEVLTAYVTDPTTGSRTLDAQKMLTLPLLQSVVAETLRLHMCFNITREAVEPVEMDGYAIPKGAMLQAPTEMPFHDEDVWAVDGHAASEFWPARHVKYVDKTDEAGTVTRAPQFAMRGRPSDFFPFGGGVSICPGRHFAKQEIMMTLAILVARFDVKFVCWTNLDGSSSDRPAQNDDKYAGSAVTPPDRDMKVSWKRLW